MDITWTNRGTRRLRRLVGVVAAVVAAAGLGAPGAHAADSGLRPAALDVTGWTRLATPGLAGARSAAPGLPGPAAGDGIGPGSYLLIDQTDGNSYICTANFVWRDPAGNRYLGAAGHCFLPANVPAAPQGDSTHQYSTRVQVCVSSCAFGGQLGTVVGGALQDLGDVVYARQSMNGTDVGNDFGLVRIPPGTTVRPNMPVWGGPSGAPSAPTLGQRVCLYGNAGGLGEVFATKARAGVAGVGGPGSWYASVPSAPGDSGAAVVLCPALGGANAAGILTHLATNGTGFIAGTTVARAIEMAHEANLSISVVNP